MQKKASALGALYEFEGIETHDTSAFSGAHKGEVITTSNISIIAPVLNPSAIGTGEETVVTEAGTASRDWVAKWVEDASKLWTCQWDADGPERDWEVAEGMLRDAVKAKGTEIENVALDA